MISMAKEIIIYKPEKRMYGNEYPVHFIDNGRLVFKTVLFGNDLRYVKQAGPSGFESAKVIRKYRKGK